MIEFDRDSGIPELTEGARARFGRFEKVDITIPSKDHEAVLTFGEFAGSAIFANTNLDSVSGILGVPYGDPGDESQDMLPSHTSEDFLLARKDQALLRLSILMCDWQPNAYREAMDAGRQAIMEEIHANQNATLTSEDIN